MKIANNFSTGLLVTFVVLAIVVIFSTCVTSTKVQPYNRDPKYTTVSEAEEGFTPVKYATTPDGKPIDIKDRNLIESTAGAPTAQRVQNMGGLFGPQDNGNKLDIYSTARGNLSEECANTSNGMSNSQGYLCLDAEQQKMLTTRGGNQTACPRCK